MVKGISKRVVVLKMDEEALFEEAIFIVRNGRGCSSEDILREAKTVALDCSANAKKPTHRRFRLPAPAFAAFGAALTAALWFAARLIGI